MPSILVVLAEGFEELEAAAPITIGRRAGFDVVVAGLAPGPVRGARGLTLLPDTTLADVAGRAYDAVVLPGGFPGTTNLRGSPLVAAVVRAALDRSAVVGAICAAPTVLAALDLLAGRRATAHATVRAELAAAGATVVADEPVVRDGPFLTSQGAGTAIDFGLALVATLADETKAAEVAARMMRTT